MAATDVIQKLPVSSRLQTPPSSPELPPYKHTLSSEHVQLFVDLLKAAQAIQTAPAAAGADQPANNGETSEDKEISRAKASKLEFKTVNKIYIPSKVQVQKS